ncbi:rhodanese-like domain-containing protein [Nocardioides donggukensis]|uniref:Rhodanese-like domain-containing protein n=1 Tax=Nocardioides donggukensis TaxID=2774019 RepID=A0A927K197_9ACTN|nr:rhodanese-like domain-containing protein [Nocardioides donggukensis]MBD8868089.1 rhodanese-like domain-containing protein [Nocardioides donggukensis]
MQVPTVSIAGLPDPVPDHLAVLDVREQAEWDHGHIEGALHVPLWELPGRVSEIPRGQVLVVCRVGGRSAQAVAWLAERGHDAVNLAGGMLDWAGAGRPMVSATGRPPQVV